MKRIINLLLSLIIAGAVYGQAPPQKMSYQGIVRNAQNQLIKNNAVGMRISILQGSLTGTAVYVETHVPQANGNGTVTIEIGNGTVVSGVFEDIDWGSDIYFLQTETDPQGAASYSITAVNQLLSVPYAMYSEKSGSVESLDSTMISDLGYVAGSTGAGNPKPFYLGQDTLGGIVFVINEDRYGVQHGFIVSKTEADSVFWQTVASATGATSHFDGEANTALLSNSPPANFVAGLGAGWYVPSVNELTLLMENIYYVNKGLSTS